MVRASCVAKRSHRKGAKTGDENAVVIVQQQRGQRLDHVIDQLWDDRDDFDHRQTNFLANVGILMMHKGNDFGKNITREGITAAVATESESETYDIPTIERTKKRKTDLNWLCRS